MIPHSAGTELKLSRKWTEFVRSYIYVGFEVLTVIVLKSCIVSDITPCSPLKISPRFGAICLIHLKVEEYTIKTPP
jgi:hypothetical protein